jgi:outer membrane receptor for ferrienterochelin and colicins
MKKLQFLLLLILCYTTAQSQIKGSVSGVITNKETSEPIQGVTITVKDDGISTISNPNGSFTLSNISTGKKILLISHIGFQTIELPVTVTAGEIIGADITLTSSHQMGNEVVVSASKRPEKITDAPASIQVIGQKELTQFSGSNVGELAAYVQGVEFTRNGVNGVSFNARGMNNAFNNKVFQMVDGRNSMMPLSGGLMMGNNISINKEDIERIEILLGPQTSLYGPNVHNALFNYITKDPRKYTGTTLALSAGNQQQFSGRLRHAAVINNKWAYKLTGEHSSGRDFEFYDSVYAGGGPNLVFGPPIAIPERINFDFRHIRGEGHIFYSITPKADIIVSAGGSNNNFINTHTGGRNQFVGVTNHFLQGRFVSPRFFATVYNAWADMGNKSFSVIGYTRDFWNRTHSTATTGPNARLTPEKAEIFAKRPGNTFKESPQRLNAEAQYNHNFIKQKLFVVAGVSYQHDKPRGFGVNLVDSFQTIDIKQYGAVLQVEKALPLDLRFIGAARIDHHSNFGNFVSPKLGLVKAIGEGSFRVTWGRAYSMPSILFQYAKTAGLFYGNGEGISYIPNGSHVNDPKEIKTTNPLVPEEVSTWELGYKGNVSKKLFVDVTYYNGLSKNFFSPSISVGGRILSVGNESVTPNPAFAGQEVNGILQNALFTTIFNFGDVKVYGIDVGTSYEFNQVVNLAVRYSWMDSDITKGKIENDANKDGLVLEDERSLNSPKNKGVIILNFQNFLKQKAFANIALRYVEEYDFYSGNQISTKAGEGKRGLIEAPDGNPRYPKNFDWGPLGGTTVDIRGGYHLNEMVSFTLGVTNLFDAKVREFAGSPYIRRLYLAEVRLHVPNK